MSEGGDEWIAKAEALSRCPGKSAGHEEARAAFGICVRALERLRGLLALDR